MNFSSLCIQKSFRPCQVKLWKLGITQVCPPIAIIRKSRFFCTATNEKENANDKAHRRAVFVTWVGLGKNISLCAGKAVVGVQTGSAALVADAFHSLSDMISDAVAMVALKVARRPPNPVYPYGHGKFEALGALGVSSLLAAAGCGLMYHAAEICWATEAVAAPTAAALWMSLACAGINEASPRCWHAASPLR